MAQLRWHGPSVVRSTIIGSCDTSLVKCFIVEFWRACQLSCSCVAKYLGNRSSAEVTVDGSLSLCYSETPTRQPAAAAGCSQLWRENRRRHNSRTQKQKKTAHVLNLSARWTSKITRHIIMNCGIVALIAWSYILQPLLMPSHFLQAPSMQEYLQPTGSYFSILFGVMLMLLLYPVYIMVWLLLWCLISDG